MSRQDIPLPQQRRFGETSRRDNWWITPVAVFCGLSAFIVYSTWAAFQASHYYVTANGAQYLSPFYSPVLWDVAGMESGHAWFGQWPSWWPSWIPASPSFLILWAPAGFRLTCYYYRGAYYKAFWADPPSCSVGEPRKCYRGEQSFPLIIQNIHRYFMYIAIVFIFLLAYDAITAMFFVNDDGTKSFGIGVGTIVLTLNAYLLGCYTFGCHSFRHLIGGGKNRLTKAPFGKKTYDCVSCLNRKHMMFAWFSLFWVGFSDVYVRLVSMGVWTDWRII